MNSHNHITSLFVQTQHKPLYYFTRKRTNGVEKLASVVCREWTPYQNDGVPKTLIFNTLSLCTSDPRMKKWRAWQQMFPHRQTAKTE